MLRALLLAVASAAIAALALSYSTVRDFGSFRAAILTGAPGGAYHSLASNLAQLAGRDRGHLEVIPTAGSIENAKRLMADQKACVEKFAFVQDGTPVPAEAELELLGRLPEPESLLLLARRDRPFVTFSDLRGASIGIGPENSGTAYLVRQLLADPDLKTLDIRTSYRDLEEQAQLVALGNLDIAAYVMRNDAEFLRTIIGRYDLEIIELRDLRGLTDRYPWPTLGRVPAGRYDLMRQAPATDKLVPQVNTLVLAHACAKRADRIELLVLLAAALPTFVRSNPPSSTSSATEAPLSSEARQFFLTGEPEFVDRYFPWLVNLMSPAYWIYLVMAVTALFNLLKGISRFRLWRLDSAREKLEAEVKLVAGDAVSHAPAPRRPTKPALPDADERDAIKDILDRLARLRERCQRYANSFATPMGEEMFYRYQQFLIDRTTVELRALLGAGAHNL
ncbi:TRAP transporter solute receptor, TAXI family [Bosea sp. LC85]|uniref:TAXI family TRAP transporter solute-binding subunit n=1 Tax=Bosea sp. LC85 TaxID=1502851 RepID=UPI0004E33E6D|nr:TAXI family TRAP transporter solute-binding subunit [Bosea sp. LC85]KFC66830.1 TRAP transporter solute receptor, TAXI family [Bosea sp. LC85]